MTRKVDSTPLGPAFPMAGFALTPDRKLGYSLMVKATKMLYLNKDTTTNLIILAGK